MHIVNPFRIGHLLIIITRSINDRHPPPSSMWGELRREVHEDDEGEEQGKLAASTIFARRIFLVLNVAIL